MKKTLIILLLIAMCLLSACTPPMYEHAVINNTDADVIVEFRDYGCNEQNNSFCRPALIAVEDLKQDKDAWHELNADEYEFLKMNAATKSGSDADYEAAGFRVRVPPKQAVRVYRSERSGGEDLQRDKKLTVTGKTGLIRLEGKQAVAQFKPLGRRLFGLDSTIYLLWYE